MRNYIKGYTIYNERLKNHFYLLKLQLSLT